MAIIEYNQSNPHPAGFIGIRLFVRKSGGEIIQQYYNFRNRTKREQAAMRREARQLNAEHLEASRQAQAQRRIETKSYAELSDVVGVFVTATTRKRKNNVYQPLIAICVTGRRHTGKNGIIKRFEKSITQYSYPWFKEAWLAACQLRAEHIGLTETPKQWLKAIPSKAEVAAYIEKKTGQRLN